MQSLIPVLAQAEGAGGLAGFLPLLLIGVVFYFLLIRPQQKRAKAQRQLVESISAGDRIVTIGGIHGTVQSIDADTIRLEVAPGTTVTMLRASVARRLVDADTGTAGSTEVG